MGLVKKKKKVNDNTTFMMDVSSGQKEGGCECGEKTEGISKMWCCNVVFLCLWRVTGSSTNIL